MRTLNIKQVLSLGLAALLCVALVGAASAAEKPAADKSGAGKSAPAKPKAKTKAKGKAKEADPSAVAPPRLFGSAYPANPALKTWLSEAGTDSFYLVLDPPGRTLQLVLGGVVIRTFEVSEVKVATPRRLAGAAHLPKDWHERVWTGAKLDPPHPGARTEIVGPEIGTASGEVLVPPTPEEAIPVPSMYRIHFAEGLTLEMTGGVAEQKGVLPPTELPKGFKEKIRMLREGAPDPLRVRLTLQPDAYSEIYRALPPGTDFVIVHGGS